MRLLAPVASWPPSQLLLPLAVLRPFLFLVKLQGQAHAEQWCTAMVCLGQLCSSCSHANLSIILYPGAFVRLQAAFAWSDLEIIQRICWILN